MDFKITSVDVEKLKLHAEDDFCKTPKSRYSYGEVDTVNLHGFDRAGFHKDGMRFAGWAEDPQKLIENLMLFSRTYINGDTNACSLILLDTPGDFSSAKIYTPKTHHPKIDRFIPQTFEDWDIKNPKSIARNLWAEPGHDTYYTFNNSDKFENTYLCINKKIKDLVADTTTEFWNKVWDTKQHVIDGENLTEDSYKLTRRVRRDNVFRTTAICTAILIPIYVEEKPKGMLLLGYADGYVMHGVTGSHDHGNLYDLYLLKQYLNAGFIK